MKYCRNCGAIYAESYKRYDNDSCIGCSFPLIEDPNMTEEKFLKLSELEKDEYELHIIELCKQSGYFNEKICERGKHYDWYYAFRFDKYEQLSGKKAPIKKELTPDEEAIEKWKRRQEIDRAVANYSSSDSNNQIHCPTCGSTQVSKIFTTSKVAGAVAFGLFSKTARSQFKCGNCGYKW